MSNYRDEIIQRLPRLETLDDVSTNRSIKLSSSETSNDALLLFQQDWSLIEECIAAGMAPPDDKLACNQSKNFVQTVFFCICRNDFFSQTNRDHDQQIEVHWPDRVARVFIDRDPPHVRVQQREIDL